MLADIGLSAGQAAARHGGIGASDATIIASGDLEAVAHLWRVKRGLATDEGALDDVLPVRLGQWTEAFNRQWFERRTGLGVEAAGEPRVHPDFPWMRCTLDGLVRTDDGRTLVFEAKHVSARASAPELLDRYAAQLTHLMLVTGTDEAVLSVLYGNNRWEAYGVDLDLFHAASLFEAEAEFWDAVTAGTRVRARRLAPPRARVRLVAGGDDRMGF